jgi:hypothetical protein
MVAVGSLGFRDPEKTQCASRTLAGKDATCVKRGFEWCRKARSVDEGPGSRGPGRRPRIPAPSSALPTRTTNERLHQRAFAAGARTEIGDGDAGPLVCLVPASSVSERGQPRLNRGLQPHRLSRCGRGANVSLRPTVECSRIEDGHHTEKKLLALIKIEVACRLALESLPELPRETEQVLRAPIEKLCDLTGLALDRLQPGFTARDAEST